VRHVHLLKQQLSLGLLEGRERASATEMNADAGEVLVEAAKHVEGERAVRDGRPEIIELISHLLEAPAVVGDGEVALGEAVELDVEEDGASLAVPQEVCLHSDPQIACRGAAAGDGLGEIVGEGAGDPGLDDTVHARPVRGSRGAGVDQHVILLGELASGQ